MAIAEFDIEDYSIETETSFNPHFPDFHRCSTSYLTHDVHPFAAKFPPQLPQWGIRKFSAPGDVVLDPFCGSGTTLVEARLAGRHAWGVDIDPLAVLMSTTKATPICVKQLRVEEQSLRDLLALAFEQFRRSNPRAHLRRKVPGKVKAAEYTANCIDFENRDYWYHPQVCMELSLIAHLIGEHAGHLLRPAAQLALSSTIIAKEKSSAANVADLVHTRPHLRKKDRLPNTQALFSNRLSRICASIAEFSATVASTTATLVHRCDARCLSHVQDSAVDLIFTSPPYINALDYPRTHKFGLAWIGYPMDDYRRSYGDYIGLTYHRHINSCGAETLADIEQVSRVIRSLGDVSPRSAMIASRYFSSMRLALSEMLRVLKPQGKCAIVVGGSTLAGVPVDTPSLLASVSEEVGFAIRDRHVRKLDAAKRCLPYGFGGMSGGINKESIIIMERPPGERRNGRTFIS